MPTNHYTVKKLAAGGTMIAAGPLILASYFLWPSMLADGAKFVAETIEIGRDRATWSLILGGLYFPLLVIAVMGLVRLLRDRKSAVGVVAGGLAVIGLVLTATSIGIGAAQLEVSFADIAAADKAVIVERTMTSGSVILLWVGPLLTAIGTTFLGFALYAAATVPRISAVLFALYGPLLVVGYGTTTVGIVIAGFAAMTVALIPVGLSLLGRTEEEWEHPPIFKGYRIAKVEPA